MMGEELKGRIEHLLRHYEVRWDSIDFSLNEVIAALVTEEVDAMKEAAIRICNDHREAYKNNRKEGNTHSEAAHQAAAVLIREAIQSLTPSTAQSREREIRADELLKLWQKDYVCNGGYGPGYLTEKGREWVTERRAELESASSQLDGPGSREREIRQARLEVGQHMLEVFNRGMTGEGIGKYFDGYVENLAAELSASSQPKGAHDYKSTACFHEQHDRCRQECKFCAVKCSCACHSQPK